MILPEDTSFLFVPVDVDADADVAAADDDDDAVFFFAVDDADNPAAAADDDDDAVFLFSFGGLPGGNLKYPVILPCFLAASNPALVRGITTVLLARSDGVNFFVILFVVFANNEKRRTYRRNPVTTLFRSRQD